MNIILIGNNGAGKSTIANKLYKEGYHTIKEAPRGKPTGHASFSTLCLTDYNLVFDRWNVIDRAIYEGETEYMRLITMCPDIVNRNNVIIYMVNNAIPYDDSEDESRSVQRPTQITRARLDLAYDYQVDLLKRKGIEIVKVEVKEDVEETYSIIKSIIARKTGENLRHLAGGDL